MIAYDLNVHNVNEVLHVDLLAFPEVICVR